MRNHNLNYRIDVRENADVVVIGSGIAGVCAAIAAARLGCDVILLENDAVLGGNSSPNLGIHISGAHSFHPYASETGIIGELEEEGAYRHAKILTHGHHYNIARQWDSLLYNMMRDAGAKVRRRHHAKLPLMDGNRIKSVLVEDLATYKTKLIDVNLCVIEASGDGQVAKEAGAEFRMGREAKSEFNERSAPDSADKITLGTSVTALVRKANQPVKFVPPEGTPEFVPGYGYSQDAHCTAKWSTCGFQTAANLCRRVLPWISAN
ncbi:MAG: FAD-dependent oxidoreductase [Candidatus Poribacteria bacterium]